MFILSFFHMCAHSKRHKMKTNTEKNLFVHVVKRNTDRRIQFNVYEIILNTTLEPMLNAKVSFGVLVFQTHEYSN